MRLGVIPIKLLFAERAEFFDGEVSEGRLERRDRRVRGLINAFLIDSLDQAEDVSRYGVVLSECEELVDGRSGDLGRAEERIE